MEIEFKVGDLLSINNHNYLDYNLYFNKSSLLVVRCDSISILRTGEYIVGSTLMYEFNPEQVNDYTESELNYRFVYSWKDLLSIFNQEEIAKNKAKIHPGVYTLVQKHFFNKEINDLINSET